MPIDLYLTRGASRSDPGSAPIDATTLRGALGSAGFPAEPAVTGEDALWVRYPEWVSARAVGEWWFRAAIVDGGVALLSASYSNPRVVRNVLDLLGGALRVGSELGARVIESEHPRASEAELRIVAPGVETRVRIDGRLETIAFRAPSTAKPQDREVTAENLETLRAPTGTRVQALVAAYDATRTFIARGPRAAVEIPIGTLDIVQDYALFEAWPERAVSLATLARALESSGRRVHVDEPVIFVFDGEDVTAQARLRNDGHWQIRPSHGWAMWPRIARTALDVANEVRRIGGGRIGIAGLSFDARLEREAEALVTKSGVDFFVWALSHGAGMPLRAAAGEA